MSWILVIAYMGWAVYSGYQFLSGRSVWLDQRTPANMAVKIVLSFGVGIFIGVFYLIYMFLKWLGFMSKITH